MSYYKRNLPHYQSFGYSFFVTIRLNGTIPIKIIAKYKREYEIELAKLESIKNIHMKKDAYSKLNFQLLVKYEKYSDSSKFGRRWLKEDNIAQVLLDTYRFYDKKRYDIIYHTIMSNHSHIILLPIKGYHD